MTSPPATAGDAAVRTPSLRRRVVLSVLGLLIIVLTGCWAPNSAPMCSNACSTAPSSPKS